MNKFCSIFIVLLLTSCIDVKDYGAYWDKASIDNRIIGHWHNFSTSKDEEANIFVRDNSYEIYSYDCKIMEHSKKCSAHKPDYPVRSLVVGNYSYLLYGPGKGEIWRYEITNDILTLYDLDVDAAADFISKNYSDSNVIHNENITMFDSNVSILQIDTLDESAMNILSKIPDDPTYWKQLGMYKKQK